MALPSIYLPLVQREVWKEVPSSLFLPYGGYFGPKVPNKPRSRRWLAELDVQVTTAANVVASGALNTPASRRPNQIIDNRSVQIVRSERFGPRDLEWMGLLGDSPGPAARAAVKDWMQQTQIRNGEGVATTRGYLIHSALVGSINWTYLGIDLPSTNVFRMPPSLQLVPNQKDRNVDGTLNPNGTPISNLAEADYQAKLLSGAPFSAMGLSRAAKIAMVATNEYQRQALSAVVGYRPDSLPVANTAEGDALIERVTGKRLVTLDETFQQEAPDGGLPITRRYHPDNLTLLWHLEDEGKDVNWEWSNVPLEKMLIAEAMGDPTFAGTDGLGPLPFAGGDRVEFTSASQYMAQEGMFTRKIRTVSATILNEATS